MAVWMRLATACAAFGLLLGVGVLAALAQPGGTQMRGIVERVADDRVTLTDGSSFPITEQTRVTQLWPITMADLVPGHYVAISASRGMDGVLLASVVSVFPEGVRPGEGQREMTNVEFCAPGCQARDLMTNANVDEARVDVVEGGELTISFLGETGQVRITADTRIEMQSIGSLDDVMPGAQVVGFVNAEGVAPTVWVFMN